MLVTHITYRIHIHIPHLKIERTNQHTITRACSLSDALLRSIINPFFCVSVFAIDFDSLSVCVCVDAFSFCFSLRKNASIDLSLCFHIFLVPYLADDINFADAHTIHRNSSFFPSLSPQSVHSLRFSFSPLLTDIYSILIMLFVLMLKV